MPKVPISLGIYLTIVIRNETRAALLIFLLEIEIIEVAVQRIHQSSKRWCGFCNELLSENDFEAVLVFFCCYVYGANASQVVQKIAID